MSRDELIITEEDIKELGLEKSSETRIEVFVEADVNDGDYIERTSTIYSLEDYKEVSAIADKIFDYGDSHNWLNAGEYLTSDERSTIRDYLPYLENEEIHTIETIKFTIIIDGVIYE